MAVALIADAHLGGPGGQAEPLVAQLRDLGRRDCRRIVFLGDLFHVWIGERRYETPDIRRVAEALAELRQAGQELFYVEGNRDFFLASSPYAGLFDEVAPEVSFEAAGKRYLAVHGDGLNDRDWRYRFWRRLSKSGPSRFFASRLPCSLARRIVTTGDAWLARTNFKHKIHIPERVIRSYGERRLREGYDILLLGHFHQSRRFALASGEVRLLEAWFHRQRLEWIAE